jgi:hypothetical protein
VGEANPSLRLVLRCILSQNYGLAQAGTLIPAMFEDIKEALRALLHGEVTPEDRRSLLAAMRDTLVRVRMGREDLEQSVEVTRKRLAVERAELETVRRRKSLAEKIGDQETITIAERFEVQHLERVTVFERKLEAQESELALVERELTEMTQQLKSAQAGVGSGLAAGATGGGASADAPGNAPGSERGDLDQEIDSLDRARRRATSEADAEARLAELKRRMGQ